MTVQQRPRLPGFADMPASWFSDLPLPTGDWTSHLQGPAKQAWEYWVDAGQRSVLFWDAMRKRGNIYQEHLAKGRPPVLTFDYEMVMDGRELERPVNYALLRILPDPGVEVDPTKRPFVVVDPRAGHGPGIGGSKHDSQIGVATRAGHPCYFVTFFPEPEPGQTIADVGHAEYLFLKKVMELHPKSEAKPVVVGNCQAGWAVAMLSAVAPDVAGPILLNGAPLSYWRGDEPMRFTGGLLGGAWLTQLVNDLGNGKFDGAWLVYNFENLNPSNTLWSKQYNLYAKIDTEEERFLDFEKWWGGFFLMNAEEMRFIVNNLFVGNRLHAGAIVTEDGRRVDLRNIRSPILIFASWGDNITPPQQALGWVTDLYDSEDEIIANEQTIVYGLHENIGHLGIFVSSKIAKTATTKIVQNLDVLDTLPPGLYEAVAEPKKPGDPNADLVEGDMIIRFESRTMDNLRALTGEAKQDPSFETVARVSDINLGLYNTFVSPWVRMWCNETTAEALRQMHPLRIQHNLVSDRDPFMAPVAQLAETVRKNRRPAAADNPFTAVEKMVSDHIVRSLDLYRDMRDAASEAGFKSIYNSPWLQAMVGLRAPVTRTEPKRVRDEARQALIEKRMNEIKSRMEDGGFNEGVIRILAYTGQDRDHLDTRSFRMLQRIHGEYPLVRKMTPVEIKTMVKEQVLMVLLDAEQALATLPALLTTREARASALDFAKRVAAAPGPIGDKRQSRFRQVEEVLDMAAPAEAKPAAATPAAPEATAKKATTARKSGTAAKRKVAAKSE